MPPQGRLLWWHRLRTQKSSEFRTACSSVPEWAGTRRPQLYGTSEFSSQFCFFFTFSFGMHDKWWLQFESLLAGRDTVMTCVSWFMTHRAAISISFPVDAAVCAFFMFGPHHPQPPFLILCSVLATPVAFICQVTAEINWVPDIDLRSKVWEYARITFGDTEHTHTRINAWWQKKVALPSLIQTHTHTK